MKKTKLSKLFSQSAYHTTKADEALIKAILEQSHKKQHITMSGVMKKLIILAGVILIGIAAYSIFTIVFTPQFYELPSTLTQDQQTQQDEQATMSADGLGDTQTNNTTNTGENWEEALFKDIEAILLNQEE